jgi:hypothetical protein
MFTLAVFIAESDKARALQTMNDAYNAELIYAPADLVQASERLSRDPSDP